MNILAVDDEENILLLYDAILSKEGHKVYKANNGSDGLDIFYSNHIDMIILDEMMPLMSGNEVVKAIRKEDTSIPVIMVTAKGTILDKKTSFDLGVDDYMVKPIDSDELIMRINALARRSKINAEKQIKVGETILNENDRSVSNTTTKINLSKTEFGILYKLLSYPEKVFSKWELFEEFWGVNSDTDESIVKVIIFKIRKLIEPFPEIEVRTVMGVGYQGVKHEKQ